MDLSIIIVNWNTRQLLDNCLVSIYRETQNISFEIFVVDNASTDNSAQMAKEKYPRVHLIQNQKNIGFAAANNQAMKQAQGKYILILNPDTVILENALEKAIEIVETYPEVGILGPKTLNRDLTQQKTVASSPNLLSQIFLLTKLKHLLPKSKIIKKYQRFDFNYENESYVEQIQGSFMLIRKKLLDVIGLFDEKFFIWFEEVDLCLRTKVVGYKILYTSRIKIIHYGAESFKQVMTLKKQWMYNRSLFYYFWKHKPRWQYFILWAIEMPSLLLAGLAGIVKKMQ